jgi:cytochrome P450 family 130
MGKLTARPYDPLDRELLADPYPGYRRLRDEDPVHHYVNGGLSFWVLSRFEDVWDALRRPQVFASGKGITFHKDEIAALGLAPTIVMLDPPRHTQLRALVSRAFTQRRVADLEDRIRAFVAERISVMEQKVSDGETPDLQRDLATRVPTFVLATLLGVPHDESGRFDRWVRAFVRLQDDGFRLPDEPNAVTAVAEMHEWFGEVIADRRVEPGDDLISALTLAEIDGERLTDWDILGFCFVIVAGGNDTTGNLISHGVQLLDGDHGQREQLVEDPELIPSALIEFLRLETSVQGLCRTTTQDVNLHGTEIPEGSKVMMLFGSGNRDDREFGSTVEVLDIHRTIPRHLGFGTGNHFCVGSHLAQLQARVAFEELLRRQPTMGVDASAGTRVFSSFARGWESLPATGIVPPSSNRVSR